MAAPKDPSSEIDLSGFGLERVQHIGKGAHASAQLVKETATGQTYVAKCISLAALNEHDQDLADQEVVLLQTLSHPYIVSYRDSFLVEGANMLVIVMEYCNGGDLRKAIKEKAKAGEHFPEDQVMAWFVQLCLALQYIHSEKVLHRDLKTSNIFLTEGGTVVKLGDFGISRVLENTDKAAVTIVGTPYYMSPELCRSEPYNWKSDVWALGCVLYELCMLKHAFESSSLMGLVYKIVSDHYEPIPSFYSQELNGLIRQLLNKSAESRPSINEVFANPYVKAHLSKHDPVPVSPLAEPIKAGSKPRFRQDKAQIEFSPQPAEQPPAPGPPQLGPESAVLIIAARIRRRLVGQKLNWISSCAAFDDAGDGELGETAMGDALVSMTLGLSEEEIQIIIRALAPTPGGKISLDTFSAYLTDEAPEVDKCETWARQILAAPGNRLHHALHEKDPDQHGTLAPQVFKAALQVVVPVATPSQLDLLVLLADKNGLGDVDYEEFINAYGAPLTPESPPAAAPRPAQPAGPAAPPGMPPLPGAFNRAAPTPPGMPPLPGAPPPQGAPQRLDPAMTNLSMGDINLERTFFTCTLASLGSATATGARRVTLSGQGCALVFSRMRRRLDAIGLPIADALALFTHPGERELSSEMWLDVAASLPLGVSRAEMQALFSKLDANNTGKVPIEAITGGVMRTTGAECVTPPKFIALAMQGGLGNRICEALQKLGGVGGAELARESDFRRVTMQNERYLTTDQLNSLILLADKSPDGHVDYIEFAQRFGGVGTLPLRVPGGLLPAVTAPAPGAPPSEDENRAVASRTGAVLERHGLSPERLPVIVSLWGAGLSNDVVAELLASLPLSMSRREAVLQLQATGSIDGFAAKLLELRNSGLWKANLEWAAVNIPGPKLRAVLQSQIAEAESRTLEPAEFVKALVDAGTHPGNTASFLWLVEKTAQGGVRIAEVLETFGGLPPATAKKKRGMFWRMVGR